MPEIALDLRPASTAQIAPPPAEPVAFSPAELLAALRRHWPLILALGLLFAIAGYVFAKTALPQRYTSSGTIAVEMRSFAIPALQGALSSEGLPDPMPQVRSEVQELSSRALVQSVADELNLAANPEFNATLRPPSLQDQIRTSVARTLAAVGLGPPVPANPAPPTEAAIRDGVVGAVSHNLSIINDNRSMIVDVQFTAEDPDVAAAVVNSLIHHYIGSKSKARDTANVEANSALGQRVTEMRGEITALEHRIEQTRQKYNLVQTRAGSVGQQQLEDLSSALTKASSDRAQLEANYARAVAMARAGGVATDSSEVLGSSTIGTLRDREASAARRVAELSTTLGPGHPQLRAAQAQLASARGALASEAQRVIASLGAQAGAARQREADLKRQLSDAQTSASGLSSVQSELQQLEKDADARRAVYQTLLQGEAQTANDKTGSTQTGVRVVSLAVPPIYPSSPRPKIAGAFGLLGGCALGGLIALVRRRRDDGFALADEVTAETGLATLAVLPRLRARGSLLAAEVVSSPHGPEAEALRALRMRMRFIGGGSAPRSMLFVSSLAGEGTSSIAGAFARVAAMDGLRVLLVEGDLQTPSLARVLAVPASNGMVEALEGREHWRDEVVRDPATPLELLLVSNAQPAASHLLEAMQLQNLIAEAKDEYNLIVMDGQPVTQATHSMVLAHIVDAVVLVVEASSTPRETVREAVGTVGAAARRPPVVALNKAA